MAREPVTQDSNPVDRTTAVKMDLQLICSSTIIYLERVQQRVKEWKTYHDKEKTDTRGLTFPT